MTHLFRNFSNSKRKLTENNGDSKLSVDELSVIGGNSICSPCPILDGNINFEDHQLKSPAYSINLIDSPYPANSEKNSTIADTPVFLDNFTRMLAGKKLRDEILNNEHRFALPFGIGLNNKQDDNPKELNKDLNKNSFSFQPFVKERKNQLQSFLMEQKNSSETFQPNSTPELLVNESIAGSCEAPDSPDLGTQTKQENSVSSSVSCKEKSLKKIFTIYIYENFVIFIFSID